MKKKVYIQPLASLLVFSPEVMDVNLTDYSAGNNDNTVYDAPARKLYL